MQRSIIHYFSALIIFLIPLYLLYNADNGDSLRNIDSSKAIAPVGGTTLAAASSACDCTITQGPNVYYLGFMTDTMTASQFYNYSNPNGSSSNTGLELSETMLIMLYEDLNTGNESLIVILDEANDGTGGSGSVTFNCLPGSAFVEFSDDGGELAGNPPTITGNFSWASCCTDGGIIGNVGCGVSMTIDPDFISGIELFALVYGTPDNPVYVPMPEVNCPIVINCGGSICCDELLEYTVDSQNAMCEGDNTGYIDLTVECVNEPMFAWSNGETTEDLYDLFPGTYSVTITDGLGCSAIEDFVIEADFPLPAPLITGDTEFCEGDFALLNAGGGYTSYEWSNGGIDQFNYITTPGVYSVTVTNAGECTGTATITVDEYPSPQPEITGPLELCEGEVITLDVGPGFDTYNWSDGSNSQSIDVFAYGNYSVTVTNEFGCIGFDDVSIQQLTTPYPYITGPESMCTNTIITLNAGLGFDSYSWSTGESTQTINITEGGNYSVTVTSNDGCEGSNEFEVIENPSDSLIYNSTSCNPQDTGVFITEYINTFGCPSVEIVTISYSESDSVLHFQYSCDPQDTGVIVQELSNQYGCDSFDITFISLAPTDSMTITLGVCDPQDTGVIVQVLTNQFGCDSTVSTIQYLFPKDTTYVYDQSCDIENVGITDSIYTNQHGCDSLVVTEVTFTLIDTNYQTATTCDPNMAGISEELFFASNGCDSLVITSTALIPIDTMMLAAETCDIMDAGISEAWITGANGCDTLVITNTAFIHPDTNFVQEFTCDPNLVGVSENVLTGSSGCDSLIITTTDKLPTDSTFVYFETCLAVDTGMIVSVYTNQYDCDSVVFEITGLAPPSACALSAFVLQDTIGCFDATGSLWLVFDNGIPPYQYFWQDQNGNTGSGNINENNGPQEISGLAPGYYTIEVSDPQGLVTTLNAEISQLEPIQSSVETTSSFNGSDISCYGASDGQATAVVEYGGRPPYEYNWSNGSKTATAANLAEDVYTVTITGALGCVTVDSILLNQPDSIELDLVVSQPDCFNDGLGAVSVGSVGGGTVPYEFALNNNQYQSDRIFTSLNSGNYTIEVVDANGCTAYSSIEIIPYDDLLVDLGRDTIIDYGDSLNIYMNANIGMDGIEWIEWDGLNCQGCSFISVSPTSTTTYYVTIIDTLGCEAEDDVEVIVRYNYGMHYPNVFSPDNDGVNDYFTIYGDGTLHMIRRMVILDRWGEKMFAVYNIPPGDPTVGWDGKFSGQSLNPGVYVFVAEVEFLDGTIRQIQGDVTITR